MSATTKPDTDQSSDAQNQHLCCDEDMPEAIPADNSKPDDAGTAPKPGHAAASNTPPGGGPMDGIMYSSGVSAPIPTVFTPGSGPFVLGGTMPGHLTGSAAPQVHSTIIKAEPGGSIINGCSPMQLSAPSSCSELGSSLARPQGIPATQPRGSMMHNNMFQGGIFSATSPSAAQAAAAAREAFAALATSGGFPPGFANGASTFTVPRMGFASSVPQGWPQQPSPAAAGPGRLSLQGAGSAGNGLALRDSVCGKRMSNGMLSPRSTLQSSQQSSMLSR
jgi:hypothetical protein